MTALVDTEAPLTTVPCWDIKVNLTPPEVVASRHLRSIRRVALLVLVAFALLAVAVYTGASYMHHRAASQLADANATTSALEARRASYSDVTDIKAATAQVHHQLAGLMTSDVELSPLLGSIRRAVPGDMRVSDLQLTLQPVGVAAASGSNAIAGSSLDPSGNKPIGTVTVSGQSKDFLDVSEFTARLKALKGVIDVAPGTNTGTVSGFQFSVAFKVTEQRLSHRYSPGGSVSR